MFRVRDQFPRIQFGVVFLVSSLLWACALFCADSITCLTVRSVERVISWMNLCSKCSLDEHRSLFEVFEMFVGRSAYRLNLPLCPRCVFFALFFSDTGWHVLCFCACIFKVSYCTFQKKGYSFCPSDVCPQCGLVQQEQNRKTIRKPLITRPSSLWLEKAQCSSASVALGEFFM